MSVSSMGIGVIKVDQNALASIASQVFDQEGQLRLLSYKDYDAFHPDALRLFCHKYARYLLPTIELVGFLKDVIGKSSAIEIGSGAGDLGRFLGIPSTDNHCQQWPQVKAMYDATNQPTIVYGRNVEKLDALEAIEKYKPDVVIGAWVTNWIDPKLPPPPGGGSIFGVKEKDIIQKVKTYIVVGAEEIHRHKFIMEKPHLTVNAESFVKSRRQDNRIWIWGTGDHEKV